MLRPALFAAFLAIITFTSQAQETVWLTDFEEAKTKAKTENRPILMSFSGSDWCGNCIRLDKILFQSPAFREFAKANLVLLKLDFPAKKKNKLSTEQTEHNEKLAEKYNKKGVFPTTLLLDADGVVKDKMSYPLDTADDYVKSLKALMAK